MKANDSKLRNKIDHLKNEYLRDAEAAERLMGKFPDLDPVLKTIALSRRQAATELTKLLAQDVGKMTDFDPPGGMEMVFQKQID